MSYKNAFHMGRTVGIAVVGLAAMACLMLWLALILSDNRAQQAQEGHVGSWRILYDTYAPPAGVMVAALVVALIFAAIATEVENTVTYRYRRSLDEGGIFLAPKVVMAETLGVFHGPVTITVLIPAHNEEDRISATINSLKEQEEPPDRIIVVADNCTDSTPDLARAAEVEVFASKDNVHKKDGALNQALAVLLPDLGENDCVMVMDADTVLDQGYMTAARRRFTNDRALKSLGGLMVSPPECTVVTEVMPTWKALWHQRLRWQRGALENLGAYGITPQTTRYWFQQLGIGYGAIALSCYVALIVITALALDEWVWYPFWGGLGLLFMIEGLVGVWKSDIKAKLVAVTLIPELADATFLNIVFLKGVFDILFARQASWGHVVVGEDGVTRVEGM